MDKTLATWKRTAPGGSSAGKWEVEKKVIGTSGWDRFEKVFAGPEGRIYAIDSNGNDAERGLWRYRWTGSTWDTSLGGRAAYRMSDSFTLFGNKDYRNRITVDESGDIYAQDNDGRLKLYRFDEGARTWAINGQLVDIHFGNFNLITSGGPGIIYTRSGANRLYRYRYDVTSQRWLKDLDVNYKGLGNLSSLIPVGGGNFYGVLNKEVEKHPAGSLVHFQVHEPKFDQPVKYTYLGGDFTKVPNFAANPATCRVQSSHTPAPVLLPAESAAPVSALETPQLGTPLGSIDITYSEQVTGLRHCRVISGGDQPTACPVLSVENGGADVAFTGQPAIAVNGRRLVQILGHSRADGHYWLATQSEAGSPSWRLRDFGGRLKGRPEVVAHPNGALTYLSIDVEGALWFRKQDGRDGEFIGWMKARDTSRFAVTPTAAAIDDDTLLLIGQDVSGNLISGEMKRNDPWTVTWTSLGAGTFAGEPSIVRLPGKRFRLFARTTEGDIVTQANDVDKPFPRDWSPVGEMAAAGAPVAIMDIANSRFAVLARGPENRVYLSYETATGSGEWAPWVPLRLVGGEMPDAAATELAITPVTVGADPRWSVVYRNQNGALRVIERRFTSRTAEPSFVMREVPAIR
ncbi:tachylectin-related carbohydrate-binding protein [Pilimelia terevasa]|uniref:tachylectin-related carbohydrate-binding protein n=1 Tax=Pilimelia terevasa TaxID=53372 RepID=UPI00166AF660|nr:tachylectin-related carbohydrate-binding protein [Pilimelia terevasa]